MLVTGIVKFFNDTKAFGFIRRQDGGGDVFVHRTGLKPPLRLLMPDQVVEFKVEQTPKGLRAVNVEVIAAPRA